MRNFIGPAKQGPLQGLDLPRSGSPVRRNMKFRNPPRSGGSLLMWQPSQRQMALKNTNRTPAGAGCPPSNCYAVTHYITRRSAHPKQGMLALYPCGLHRYLLRSSSPAETLGRLARHSNRNQLRPSRTLPLQVGITPKIRHANPRLRMQQQCPRALPAFFLLCAIYPRL